MVWPFTGGEISWRKAVVEEAGRQEEKRTTTEKIRSERGCMVGVTEEARDGMKLREMILCGSP